MNRQKSSGLANEISVNYDLSPFMPHNSNLSKSVSFEKESVEALREKLQIKSEALNLLGKQLELCNKEKIEYKRLIDTLYDKNLSLKKTLYFKENQVDAEDAENNFFDTNNLSNNETKKSTSKIGRFRSGKSTKREANLSPNGSTSCLFNDIDSDDYIRILKDLIKTLQKEKFEILQKYDDTQQELHDSRSDLRLLREQIVRQRVGSYNEGLTTSIKLDVSSSDLISDNFNKPGIPGSLSSNCLSSLSIKENLIKEIESLREQKQLIEADLNLVICQKEEIEIERDSYKSKYNKLNDYLLNTIQQPVPNTSTDTPEQQFDKSIEYINANRQKLALNIDELISQNHYLSDSNRHMKEEIEILKNNIKKYKQMINSNSNNVNQQIELKSEKFVSKSADLNHIVGAPDVNVMNKLQIRNLLNRTDRLIKVLSEISDSIKEENDNIKQFLSKFQIIELTAELKSLAESLIECLNDKLIANQHQRKVNKMLATRIQDLEKQIEMYKSESKERDNNNNNTKFLTSLQSSPFSSLALPSSLKLDEPLQPMSVASIAANFNPSILDNNASIEDDNSSSLIKLDQEDSKIFKNDSETHDK